MHRRRPSKNSTKLSSSSDTQRVQLAVHRRPEWRKTGLINVFGRAFDRARLACFGFASRAKWLLIFKIQPNPLLATPSPKNMHPSVASSASPSASAPPKR
ncbi:hypothetical protein ACEPAG_8683 [Sanghuangporus baumii]